MSIRLMIWPDNHPAFVNDKVAAHSQLSMEQFVSG
jgi:hypothetical protein